MKLLISHLPLKTRDAICLIDFYQQMMVIFRNETSQRGHGDLFWFCMSNDAFSPFNLNDVVVGCLCTFP